MLQTRSDGDLEDAQGLRNRRTGGVYTLTLPKYATICLRIYLLCLEYSNRTRTHIRSNRSLNKMQKSDLHV